MIRVTDTEQEIAREELAALGVCVGGRLRTLELWQRAVARRWRHLRHSAGRIGVGTSEGAAGLYRVSRAKR